MGGTYLYTDTTNGQGMGSDTLRLIPMVANGITYITNGDSVDLVRNLITEGCYFIFDCSDHTYQFVPPAPHGGTSSFWGATGTFTPNYIIVDWGWGDFGGSESFFHDTYKRIPQITQHQIDSIEGIAPPVPTDNSVVTIYPQTNPVKQTLYFTITANDIPPTTNIRIFNMQGRCVFQNDVAIISGEQVSVNVENFAKGMYILEATIPNYTLYKLTFIKD